MFSHVDFGFKNLERISCSPLFQRSPGLSSIIQNTDHIVFSSMLSWTIFLYELNQDYNHSSIIINGMSSEKQFLHSFWFICCLLVVSPILIWCIKLIEVSSADQSFVLFLIHRCLLSLKLGVPSSYLTSRIKVAVCFN